MSQQDYGGDFHKKALGPDFIRKRIEDGYPQGARDAKREQGEEIAQCRRAALERPRFFRVRYRMASGDVVSCSIETVLPSLTADSIALHGVVAESVLGTIRIRHDQIVSVEEIR